MLAAGRDYAQQFITEVKRDMIIITGSVKFISESLAVWKEIIAILTISNPTIRSLVLACETCRKTEKCKIK